PSIKIAYNSGAGHAKVVELVQSDLKAIGINSTTETFDAPQYWPYLRTTNYQLGRDGWVADYPIADNFTNPIFNSTSADNHSHFASSTVDANILKARSTLDDATRAKMYADIQSAIGSVAPVMPIVYYSHRHVGSNRVNDLYFDNSMIAHLDKAWLTGGGATK
ncbi:MAG: ABC transporter substrate-binding protein, partial [Ilumatobacteraceae bacterium]